MTRERKGPPRRRKRGQVVSMVERRQQQIIAERGCTPVELLETMLADIKDGQIKPEGLIVSYFETDEHGHRIPYGFAAGVSTADAMTIAAMELRLALSDMGL